MRFTKNTLCILGDEATGSELWKAESAEICKAVKGMAQTNFLAGPEFRRSHFMVF